MQVKIDSLVFFFFLVSFIQFFIVFIVYMFQMFFLLFFPPEHVKFSEEELGKLQNLNPPIVLPEDPSKKSSKVKQSVKNFFSKAASELSEDAANFTKSIKEGALEIKQNLKAAQVKKDEPKGSDTIKEETEDEKGSDDDEDDDEEEEEDEEKTGDDTTTVTSNEALQTQNSTKNSEDKSVESSDSNQQESAQDKAKATATSKMSAPAASIMSALATGLQVAGLVAAGTPEEETTSIQGTLEAEEAKPVEDESPKRFDEETLKKIGEEKYDDLIVQPKPVKKKKRKPKGKNLILCFFGLLSNSKSKLFPYCMHLD